MLNKKLLHITAFQHFEIILTVVIFSIITFNSQTIYSQKRTQEDALKLEAKQHMDNGKYGEAIDLLNKYISAYPQRADGYNLRGLSFEKRAQYQYSVLDFRRARKLAKDKELPEILENLNRVLEIWHKQLRKKIEGHEREIAIDPNNPINYLEIGKSYRWLEEWDNAETWYDEYLKRDDNASPDEILRYTEILTHTGHIKKGEPILKLYTERYPDDWRIWSRYGYFTLWLGKYQIAKKAFETALGFKPFFKEAQDGLDSATKKAYVTQYDPRSFEREFPIDRYYRLLRKSPDDVEMRFKLTDELIQAERMEEALQQLQIIAQTNEDDPRYQEKLDYVTNFRDEVYTQRIELYTQRLEENPLDKEAVQKLSDYYSRLEDYDSALSVLDNYFQQVPDETDQSLRFTYAKTAAWSRDFDLAIEIMDSLLEEKPEDLDYQLFRSQLSVWHNVDLEQARAQLENVLSQRPDNVEALLAMGSLMLTDKDFDAAQSYLDAAKEVAPNNSQISVLQSRIDFEKMRAAEEALYEILNEGRDYVVAEEYEEALPYYEDYLSQAEPNNLILKEYGDVLFMAGKYDEALSTYDEVLDDGYMYEAALNKSKVLYAMGDSLAAVDGFRDLVAEEPYEFEPRLYLGDSFAKAGFPDSARAVYDTLMTWDLDSTDIAMVEQRYEWLPISGLQAFLKTFPSYVALAPSYQFYSDNLSFRFSEFGIRMDMGILQWLSLGVSYDKTYMHAKRESLNDSLLNIQQNNGDYFTGDKGWTTFKGHLFLNITPEFNIGASFGKVTSLGDANRDETEVYIRYEKEDIFKIQGQYINTDAALLLYSPYLIDTRFYTRFHSIEGYYQHPSGLRFSGMFHYITVDDGDEGNNLQLKVGRYFYEYLKVGYEYFYRNWKFVSPYYYSPSNFESHSIWVEGDLENDDEFQLNLGGQIGYIPADDFILLGGYLEGSYKPSNNLSIVGRLGGTSSSRDKSSYKSVSGSISAYWTIY